MKTTVREQPQTVIITGASQGLGYQCALNVAKEHPRWHVVLACRAPLERAEAAAESIRQQTGNSLVEVSELDVSSLQSVRRFATSLAQRLTNWGNQRQGDELALPPISALVCNAGVQIVNPSLSVDGFELTFGSC
jgi:NAD(P)-dependent dehydrogenase (short-subunit alcohol dehydrogenase family)